MIFFFIIVVACCCGNDDGSSSKTQTTNTTSKSTGYRRNTYRPSYSECPSCGAPYFDGYCSECGYPDINQGWLGENY
ncbi:hypothetical protein [Methanobrevibacter sp.]|uniref:hypothetical protein n=1 Tax=Methanobrevibacter sp. TaxID=66852 RepID=UPI0025D308B3|nr:hypothetical protein [Methanobrevibacter sp.]MBR4447198.1 hypothetical protein [Methanobrevibacter sp.]